MTKLNQLILLFALLFISGLLNVSAAQDKYELRIRLVDKDSAILNTIGLQNSFDSKLACTDYVNKLPSFLQSKGYATASVDSLTYDSSSAQAVIFLGEAYHWTEVNTDRVNPSLLNAVGWRQKNFPGKPIDFNQLHGWQEKIIDYLENNGHPFAKVYLDSLQVLDDNRVSAILKVEEGPLYKIDSVRVFGNVKIG